MVALPGPAGEKGDPGPPGFGLPGKQVSSGPLQAEADRAGERREPTWVSGLPRGGGGGVSVCLQQEPPCPFPWDAVGRMGREHADLALGGLGSHPSSASYSSFDLSPSLSFSAPPRPVSGMTVRLHKDMYDARAAHSGHWRNDGGHHHGSDDCYCFESSRGWDILSTLCQAPLHTHELVQLPKIPGGPGLCGSRNSNLTGEQTEV